MAIIENIKQKICQMEAGKFQGLCNAYLLKIGYKGLNSLGTEAGTGKTTKGTPDNYFSTPDGKYIFVEYTTQKTKLFTKIKTDLKKCLNISKTNVPHNKIVEIIYCHTSSNITPSQDIELKKLCEDVGIKFIIIGIDRLAEDLYLYYQSVASDYLGISIGTGQIESCDDFVKHYNANRMAAPLDIKFLFREKELESIDEAYKKHDVVILSGTAGAGKTRLALHYAETYSNTHNEKFFCIRSNALPIYDDLKCFLDAPGSYFLLLDDANQLSELQHIIRYVIRKPEGYNVKILITVRDYALQKVKDNIREITLCETININTFTDEEIKKLLETALGIANPDYKERIVRIAEGNARVAILAGKVACKSNRLDSINDASQLYEDYYGSFLKENLLLNDCNMCISAGIIAFLDVIYFEHIEPLLPILQEKVLSRECFVENMRKLHELEIVNISCNDKVVSFSEQCLSNYLLKYIFFDKKLLSLSTMIKACFQSYKWRTISSVNTLLNVFANEKIISFVSREVKKIWNELSEKNSPIFSEFIKAFFRVDPTATLSILQDKIEAEASIIVDINTKKETNYQDVKNDTIEILGGFADMDDLPTALDLFFQYYLKRPDLYMIFCQVINQCFSIKRDSWRDDFYTQITFFEKLEEYSNDWQQKYIVLIFLEVAKEFLKLTFTPTEDGRNNFITFYRIPLAQSIGVEKYRRLIWQALSAICKLDKYKEKVRKIFDSYEGMIENASIPVLQSDIPYIESILKSNFPATELRNCLLADKLMQIFIRANVSCESLFAEYFENELFHRYDLLKGLDYEDESDYGKRKELKRHAIEQYLFNSNLAIFKRLIDICADINSFGRYTDEVRDGLTIAFEIASIKKDYYVDAVRYYIEKDTPSNLYPCDLVNPLFSLLSDSEIFHLIDNSEYKQKNTWLYAYYHELPPNLITKRHLENLYDFLSDTSEEAIDSSPYRDLYFLEKYSVIDKNAFIKGCKIIFAKVKHSAYMAKIYFLLLFSPYRNTPQETIQRFNCDLKLLEKIYYVMLSYDNNLDYNGKFLKEFYSVRPSVLNKHIEYLIKKDKFSCYNGSTKYRNFFGYDNFIEIYDGIFEYIIQKCPNSTMRLSIFLESLLLPVKDEQALLEKQDKLIRHCIQLSFADISKMHCLFSVVSKLNIDRKKEYIKLFLKHNQSFKDFKEIPLTPTSYSVTGSAVPMYSAWVENLKLLLPDFMGAKLIKHKKHIEAEIDYLKRRIEAEQIDDILRG